MAAKFRNIYHKVRCADCENVFWYIPESVWKRLSARCAPQFAGDLARMKVLQRATTHPTMGKIYCKVGGVDWEMIFKYISELFSYCFVIILLFFNYALFYFIFIQSFCFNQNCLKVYFYITIYFSEDFYCSFACFVVQSTLNRSLLYHRVVKCYLLDFIVCFSRFLFYKSYYYILYLP